MADTNETIADIIAEMRNRAKRPDFVSQDVLKSCADRIEAAHRREVATTKESLAVGNSGDCAKLREAALAIRADILKRRSENCWYATDSDILEKIDAALAAPPRNCDRFATIDEARKAHEAICEKYGKCHNGCPLNNEEHYSAFDCFEAWLYAPSTEKEGGAK